MKAIATFAIVAAAAVSAASPAAAQRPRPVMIGAPGGDPGCWAMGEVSGLNPRGDNYLSVRAAPNVRAREVDRLEPLRQIRFCEYTRDQIWVGIVYPPRETPDADCGLDVPARPPRAYAGRCLSGWVAARYTTEFGD